MSSSSLSKLAYLSKYANESKQKKKKTKKSKRHHRNDTLLVHEDDDDESNRMPLVVPADGEDDDDDDDDGPVVVAEEGEDSYRVKTSQTSTWNEEDLSDADQQSQQPRRRRHDSSSDEEQPRSRRRHDSDVSSHLEEDMTKRRRYDSDDDSTARDTRRNDSSDKDPPLVQNGRHDNDENARRRRHDSDDDSVPSRRRRHDSSDEEENSRRSRRRRYDSDDEDSSSSNPREKMSSGHAAGLQQAEDFRRAESKLQRKRRDEAQAMVDKHGMGDTVYRDAEGRKVERKLVQQKATPQLDEKAQRLLNKGLVQREQEESRLREMEQLRESSFARYKDDTGLEDLRRDAIREGDPMAAQASEKKAQIHAASGRPQRPMYKGPAPKPNRYGIRPGYRWDGVDRGNGFEDKVLALKFSATRKKEDAYRWSSADM